MAHSLSYQCSWNNVTAAATALHGRAAPCASQRLVLTASIGCQANNINTGVWLSLLKEAQLLMQFSLRMLTA